MSRKIQQSMRIGDATVISLSELFNKLNTTLEKNLNLQNYDCWATTDNSLSVCTRHKGLDGQTFKVSGPLSYAASMRNTWLRSHHFLPLWSFTLNVCPGLTRIFTIECDWHCQHGKSKTKFPSVKVLIHTICSVFILFPIFEITFWGEFKIDFFLILGGNKFRALLRLLLAA